MKNFAFISATLLAAFGASSGASASLLGKYPLPKSVCERSHQDVIESLSANPMEFVSDQFYALMPERFDEVGVAPESKRESLLKSGLYSLMASSQKELIPRFQMGIENLAGGFGTGICWWHSRFHRAAAYLVDFAPHAKAPTSKEASRIFKRISNFLPVVVPGFDSLYEFTKTYPNELEAVLTEWELRTTVVASHHVLRPTFSTLFSSEKEMRSLALKNLNTLLKKLRANARPVFLMVNLANRVSLHSFLVTGYRKDDEGSIFLKYLDSGFPGKNHEWKIYANGKLDLRYPLIEEIASIEMLHADFESDFERIQAGLRKKCGANYMLR